MKIDKQDVSSSVETENVLVDGKKDTLIIEFKKIQRKIQKLNLLLNIQQDIISQKKTIIQVLFHHVVGFTLYQMTKNNLLFKLGHKVKH